MNLLSRKIKKIFDRGLNRRQAVVFVAVIISLLVYDLYLFFLVSVQEKKVLVGSGVTNLKKNSNQNAKMAGENKNINDNKFSHIDEDSGASIFGLAPKKEKGSEESERKNLSTEQLPIPENVVEEADSVGPLDGYLSEIKKEYKSSPNAYLIEGYLDSVKKIADGRKAWTAFYEYKGEDFLGKNKMKEIKAEIEKVNGGKEAKIRKLKFATFDSLEAAIKEDTKNYIDRNAIISFLDSAKKIYNDEGPWSDAIKSFGAVLLETAWVDQIDLKISQVKEVEAAKFRAAKFKNIDQLVDAIRKDTEHYGNVEAREVFLAKIKELSQSSRPADGNVIDSGKFLLDKYHLEEIKKFFRI